MAQELIEGTEAAVMAASRISDYHAGLRKNGLADSRRKAALSAMSDVVAQALLHGAATTDPWWRMLVTAFQKSPNVQPRSGWEVATPEYRLHRLTVAAAPSGGMIGRVVLSASGDAVHARDILGAKIFGKGEVVFCAGIGVELIPYEKCNTTLLEVQGLLPADMSPNWKWWRASSDAESQLVSDTMRKILQKGVGALK